MKKDVIPNLENGNTDTLKRNLQLQKKLVSPCKIPHHLEMPVRVPQEDAFVGPMQNTRKIPFKIKRFKNTCKIVIQSSLLAISTYKKIAKINEIGYGNIEIL